MDKFGQPRAELPPWTPWAGKTCPGRVLRPILSPRLGSPGRGARACGCSSVAAPGGFFPVSPAWSRGEMEGRGGEDRSREGGKEGRGTEREDAGRREEGSRRGGKVGREGGAGCPLPAGLQEPRLPLSPHPCPWRLRLRVRVTDSLSGAVGSEQPVSAPGLGPSVTVQAQQGVCRARASSGP